MASSTAELGRREKLLYLVLSVIATVVLIFLIYVAGIRDEEEYGVGVYSTLLNARTIFSGDPALWTNLRGFGTPLPLGQSFYFDPTFYLWPVLPISAVMMLFWAKIAVGVFCLMLWLRKIGASQLMAILGGFCFVFSIPVANATVTDDWPSVLSSWALFPVLLLLLAHLPDAKRPYAVGLGLGAVTGLWAANGHPGHLIVYVIPAAAYTSFLILAYPRIIGPLVVGAVIAVIATLDDVYYILQQLALFPKGIARGGYGPLTLNDYWLSLLRPFSFYELAQWKEGQSFVGFFRDSFDKGSTRYPFVGFGLIVGVFVLVFSVWRMTRGGQVHMIGILAALAVAFFLSLAPKSVLSSGASAMWLFRDSVLVMAIAAGALGLTLLSKFRWGRFAIVPLLTVQVLQTAVVFGEPVLFGACCDKEYGVFPSADVITPVKQRFLEAAEAHGPRMALSNYLSGRMSLGRFDNQGIHSASDLSLSGIELVSGQFKGTSQDKIFPSNGLWGGNIRFPIESFANGRMLDIAGIGVVGMYRTELNDQPPASGLSEIGSFHDNRENEVVLFSNDNAWRRVTLLPAGEELNELPIVRDDSGCVKPALWCTDFTGFPDPMADQLSDVTVTRYTVSARIPPANGDRVAFVSQLMRKGWHAAMDGGPLTIRPAVNGAFFSVQVPREGGLLVLSYDTGFRFWFFWLSLVTIWLAAIAAVVMLLRPKSKTSLKAVRT